MKKCLDIWIIIPAYNPNDKLVELIETLYQRTKNILVINDGSDKKCDTYFKQIKEKCILLESSKNCGKGNALKKGFQYVLEMKKDILGVVTADADGQHQTEDILKIESKLRENPDKFILGCRNFDTENIPFLNTISNKIMCFINKKRYLYDIKDTQTGLRGIPIIYIEDCLNIPGERYEYEFNVLKYIQMKRISLAQIEIKTIYDKQIESNYRKITDSIKILKTILK